MKETVIRRTVWVAKCETCNFFDVKAEDAPRETFCNTCMKWVPYVKETYTGQDRFDRR
jgi:hypothetical protein